MSTNTLPSSSTTSAVPLKVDPIPSEKLSVYESDSKVASSSVEGASSIHSKPGSLTEKFKVLTEATQQKLEPAIKLVHDTTEKLVKKMPDSVTNHEKDHQIYQDKQAQTKIAQVSAEKELGAPVAETKPALSFTNALKDVGQHLGETIVHTSKDLSAKAKEKYSEWKTEKKADDVSSSSSVTSSDLPTMNRAEPKLADPPTTSSLASTSSSSSALPASTLPASTLASTGSSTLPTTVPESGYSTLTNTDLPKSTDYQYQRDPADTSLDASKKVAELSPGQKEKKVDDLPQL